MCLGVAKFGRTSVTFDQVVFSEGRCVASAQAVTVLIDETTRKPTLLTEEILANFQRCLRRGAAGAYRTNCPKIMPEEKEKIREASDSAKPDQVLRLPLRRR